MAGVPAAGSGSPLEHFSFFVTSHAAMQRLSKNPQGFGGDLRFGKADGLSGGDEICRQIAETSMPGSGAKTWRAFLSVTKDASGKPVNAIDRVGEGPWYDRLGRLVAMNKADLAMTRPKGAHMAIINDLPNEDGVPNHAPEGMQVDNHDILTGTGPAGLLYSTDWGTTGRRVPLGPAPTNLRRSSSAERGPSTVLRHQARERDHPRNRRPSA